MKASNIIIAASAALAGALLASPIAAAAPVISPSGAEAVSDIVKQATGIDPPRIGASIATGSPGHTGADIASPVAGTAAGGTGGITGTTDSATRITRTEGTRITVTATIPIMAGAPASA